MQSTEKADFDNYALAIGAGAFGGITLGAFTDAPFALTEFYMGAGTVVGPILYHIHKSDSEGLITWLSTNPKAQAVIQSVGNILR
ncbi:hypothetical protein H7170_01410 [Candidatus Gracilibacteria bacterium]|nr:hypothetical protein [Candidatus Gracilibacteria bacterium]